MTLGWLVAPRDDSFLVQFQVAFLPLVFFFKTERKTTKVQSTSIGEEICLTKEHVCRVTSPLRIEILRLGRRKSILFFSWSEDSFFGIWWPITQTWSQVPITKREDQRFSHPSICKGLGLLLELIWRDRKFNATCNLLRGTDSKPQAMIDPRIITAVVLEQVSNSICCRSQTSSKRTTYNVVVIVLWFLLWSAIGPMVLVFLGYYALASPPMHLVYDVAPPAGPSSIYVPGKVEGVWWFFSKILVISCLTKLWAHRWWIFWILVPPGLSSVTWKPQRIRLLLLLIRLFRWGNGRTILVMRRRFRINAQLRFLCVCLGALAVLMNLTLDETVEVAFSAQEMWLSGNISRFQLVDHFFETMLTDNGDVSSTWSDLDSILPNMKILVTSQRDGHQVRQPQNRTDLKDLLIKTTWVWVVLWFWSDCFAFLDGRPSTHQSAFSMLSCAFVAHTWQDGGSWRKTMIYTWTVGFQDYYIRPANIVLTYHWFGKL